MLTCERPGDSWPPGFNASLTDTQSHDGCSSTGTATASVALVTAPTASLTGPTSLGVCSAASTAAGSFVVQSDTNTIATLTVAGSGFTCTTPSATGEVGFETVARLRQSSAQQRRMHSFMSAAAARHTRTHLCTHYAPSFLLVVSSLIRPRWGPLSRFMCLHCSLSLQSLPTQPSQSRANRWMGQEGGLLPPALTSQHLSGQHPVATHQPATYLSLHLTVPTCPCPGSQRQLFAQLPPPRCCSTKSVQWCSRLATQLECDRLQQRCCMQHACNYKWCVCGCHWHGFQGWCCLQLGCAAAVALSARKLSWQGSCMQRQATSRCMKGD